MTNQQVPFVDLRPLEQTLDDEIRAAVDRVFARSWYIGGEEDTQFEKEFAKYVGAQHCVGCGNGLDALSLSLRALGIGKGDEVIVPANTFIATALAVTKVGARPVLVDCNERFNIDASLIEPLITPRTKAIMPVHLYGQPADMDPVLEVASAHGLMVVEDCAQAHGARYKGRNIGTFGDAAGFSFYPGKNLGAVGDAGAMVTNDDAVAQKVRALGNYGSEQRYHHLYEGVNSRLDELQASVLRAKLKFLDQTNAYRKKVAADYLQGIRNPLIALPDVPEWADPVWHIFAVRCERRDELQAYLEDHGIGTNIHYPIPVHLQGAYAELGYSVGDFPTAEIISKTELSLPMFYGMTDSQTEYVISILNDFR